jgi:hypothetical protein
MAIMTHRIQIARASRRARGAAPSRGAAITQTVDDQFLHDDERAAERHPV